MRIHLVEKATEIVPNTPLLINMISKRVRQLNNGRSPLVPVVERMGAADIALTEIIEGKINLDRTDPPKPGVGDAFDDEWYEIVESL